MFSLRAGGVLLTALLLLSGTSWANPIKEAQAVDAILGEARGEGYRGMYAVACAIRNRGTLKGVYGLRARREVVSDEIAQKAFKAWNLSAEGPDITKGAQFWENVEKFGVPRWSRKMIKTVKIRHQTFFREK